MTDTDNLSEQNPAYRGSVFSFSVVMAGVRVQMRGGVGRLVTKKNGCGMRISLCKALVCVFAVASLSACSFRRGVPADLQQKIDSVKTLEQVRLLRLQGISLEDPNPLRVFYDSLSIQPLPLRYSYDSVKAIPNYTPIPQEIVLALNLEGRVAPCAITLPETAGTRLLLLAADEDEGEYALWLYSLDNEYFPVDKLLLYTPGKKAQRVIDEEPLPDFSITSDYEISVMEYTADHKPKGKNIYTVAPSRMFEKVN